MLLTPAGLNTVPMVQQSSGFYWVITREDVRILRVAVHDILQKFYSQNSSDLNINKIITGQNFGSAHALPALPLASSLNKSPMVVKLRGCHFLTSTYYLSGATFLELPSLLQSSLIYSRRSFLNANAVFL